MADTKRPARRSKCPSCKAVLHRSAKFCHECGAPADGRAVRGRPNKYAFLLLLVGLAALGGGLVFVVGQFAAERRVPSSPQVAVGPSAPARPAVDLSAMTPRQAADRLFNRVMAADERGDTAEVVRFAPMALQAYGLVDRLDADARYHLGLLNLLSGNLDDAAKEVERLESEAPDHLLGLVLAFKLAEKRGDDKAAGDARARYAAAYDREVKDGRPEYQAHRKTIESFRVAAVASGSADRSSGIAARPEPGARLYALKCAGCHGPSASGSDKGPPLVHRVYEPSHHADAAFYRAVRQGVRSHHWQFGRMPPVPGVTDDQIKQIVAYVRALQVQSGIR